MQQELDGVEDDTAVWEDLAGLLSLDNSSSSRSSSSDSSINSSRSRSPSRSISNNIGGVITLGSTNTCNRGSSNEKALIRSLRALYKASDGLKDKAL